MAGLGGVESLLGKPGTTCFFFCDTAIHGGYICYQMFPGCRILFNFTFTLPACKPSHTESQRRKLALRPCHL